MCIFQGIFIARFLLIWIASSSCHALKENLSLLFTMVVVKTLMTAQQPPVELTSTKAVYLGEGDALPLPGTQCIYTGIEREQMCFGNNRPTRVRLQPDTKLKLGLSPRGISQLKYNASSPPPIPEPFPDKVIFPEFDSEAKSIVTTIQQGTERQYEFTETARQNRQLWLLRSCREHMDGVADEYAEEKNETTEWWMLEEVLYDTDDSNEAKIRYEDLIHEGIPLKPDTSYCITPPLHNKTRISSDVPCDGESDNENGKNQATRQENSDSEGDAFPDEKNDSDSREEVSSVADPDCIITNVESGFEVAPEIAAYCDTLEWAAFKQEPESDDEMSIDSEIIVTTEVHSTTDDLVSPSPAKKKKLSGHLKTHMETVPEGKKKHICYRTGADGQRCNKAFGQKNNLKVHIETVHEGKKKYVCDRAGADGQPCKKAFGLKSNLKVHIDTIHEGKKKYVCDRAGADGQPCKKAFGLKSNLKIHIETIHEGKKEHVCDRTGVDGQPCKKAFGQKNNLQAHIKIIHEGKKEHVCDRTRANGQPCNQAFGRNSSLKEHIGIIHEGKREHICDRTGENGQLCKKAFGRKHDLKKHMEIVHEGKKEHVCDRTGADGQPCNKAFGQKIQLKTHMDTIHEDKKRNRKRPRIEEADDQTTDSQQH